MALVFDRCQLAPRILVQRDRRQHHQHRGRDNGPAHVQRAVEESLVAPPHRLKAAIDQQGQPALAPLLVDEARAHHGRQRHRHDARHHHRRSERDRELQEQRAREPALEADRRVHRGERDRHRDDGTHQLARADQRRLHARFTFAHVSFDVFDDDDGVVHHQSHRQHDCEDRQQVEREAEGVHHHRRPDQGHRHRHQRHQRGAQRPHEQEHDHADDENGLDQRLGDLVQCVGHEDRRVVRQLHVDVGRQLRLEPRHLAVQPVGHFDLVAAGQRPDTQIDCLFFVELGDEVGFLGAQLDARHVRQPHDGAVTLGDDEILELLGRAQIGVRQQVDLHQVALGLTHRREVVVALQRRVHVARRQVQGGEAIRIDPDAHRDGPAAQHVHALHAGERRELRLQVAREPVGQLRDVALRRREAQVERRIGSIGALHVHHRRLGLGGQLGAHLLQPRRHLRQRRRGIVIELQVHGDRADAGAAGRFDVVDTADGRHGALDRRGEKATHGLGAGAEIDRGDHDRGALDLGVLLHRQRGQRAPAHQDDGEVDDHRENGVPDERVGHGASHCCALISEWNRPGRPPARPRAV